MPTITRQVVRRDPVLLDRDRGVEPGRPAILRDLDDVARRSLARVGVVIYCSGYVRTITFDAEVHRRNTEILKQGFDSITGCQCAQCVKRRERGERDKLAPAWLVWESGSVLGSFYGLEIRGTCVAQGPDGVSDANNPGYAYGQSRCGTGMVMTTMAEIIAYTLPPKVEENPIGALARSGAPEL